MTFVKKTRVNLVPFALGAMAVACLFLAGCRKEEAKSAVSPSSPKSYMNDKKFIGDLERKRTERARIIKTRIEVKKAYDAALRDDPSGAKPETQELKKKLEATERAFMENRRQTMDAVKRRLSPEKKEISK